MTLKSTHGESRQHASLGRFDDAFFNRGNVLPRNGTAHDGVDELKSLAAWLRLELNPAVAELAVAAGLLLVPALDPHFFLDGLAVGDFGDVELDLDVELALEAFDGGFDVDLPDAVQDDLLGFREAVDAQGRVFFQQPRQRGKDLVLIALALGGQRIRHQGGHGGHGT